MTVAIPLGGDAAAAVGGIRISPPSVQQVAAASGTYSVRHYFVTSTQNGVPRETGEAVVRAGNDAEHAVPFAKNGAQACDGAREPEWSRAAFQGR